MLFISLASASLIMKRFNYLIHFFHQQLFPQMGSSHYGIDSHQHTPCTQISTSTDWGRHQSFAIMYAASTTSSKPLRSRTFSKDLQRPKEDDFLGLLLAVCQWGIFIFHMLLQFSLSYIHLPACWMVIPLSLSNFIMPSSHLVHGLPLPLVPSTPAL